MALVISHISYFMV